MPNIKLQSSDNEIFDIDIMVAKCSGTIMSILENRSVADGDNAVVPLTNVKSAVLRKVLEWANHHKDDPQPTENRTDDISSWDANFLQVDQGSLFDLITAAHNLDIKELFSVACKTLANMVRGKSADEIREIFNIPNDAPPDEDEWVRWVKHWIAVYVSK